MAKDQIGARGDTGRDQEKCRRRNIGRDVNIGRRQFAAATNTGGRAVPVDVVAKTRQHALGMIASRRRLGHRCTALGIKPGQQKTRFDLGTGHRHFIVNTGQLLATTDFQWRAPPFCGIDNGAHRPERIGNPPHRATGETRIAGQLGIKGLGRQQTGEQPHGGSRVTQIQRPAGGLKPVHANTMDANKAVVRAFNGNAHIPECLERRQAVFTLQKPFHFGYAICQSTQHDGPVRH